MLLLCKLNFSGRLLQGTRENCAISILAYVATGKGDGYNLELLSLCEEYGIDIAMLDYRCDHLLHDSFASLCT